MRQKQPKGYLIHPNGQVVEQPLRMDQSVLWGKTDKKMGTPAWLLPETMHRSKRLSFLLLATNSLMPMVNPGEAVVSTGLQKLSKVMEQQFETVRAVSKPLDGAMMSMILMWVFMLLTMAFIALAIALGMGEIITNRFGGD